METVETKNLTTEEINKVVSSKDIVQNIETSLAPTLTKSSTPSIGCSQEISTTFHQGAPAVSGTSRNFPSNYPQSPPQRIMNITTSSVKSKHIGCHQRLPTVTNMASIATGVPKRMSSVTNTHGKNVQRGCHHRLPTVASATSENTITGLPTTKHLKGTVVTLDTTSDSLVRTAKVSTATASNAASTDTPTTITTSNNSARARTVTNATANNALGSFSYPLGTIIAASNTEESEVDSTTPDGIPNPQEKEMLTTNKPVTVIRNQRLILETSRKRNAATDKLEASSKSKQKKTMHSGSDFPNQNLLRANQRQTSATEVNTEWSMAEKKLLLEALETDGGRRWWGRLASKVPTKNVDQVKHYTEILRAQANDEIPIHLEEVDSPLQAWIVACERLIDCQDDVDAKCIPQVMTIAAVEPTSSQGSPSGPNYNRIYTFLSGVLRGLPTVGLSPVDAKVVLELLHSLEIKVLSANSSEQVDFLRTKFKNVTKELEQEQIIFATEELQKEIILDEMEEARSASKSTRVRNQENAASCNTTAPQEGSTRSTIVTAGTSTSRNIQTQAADGSDKRRKFRRRYRKGAGQSSLNPVNVPVSLLNLTNKNS